MYVIGSHNFRNDIVLFYSNQQKTIILFSFISKLKFENRDNEYPHQRT